MFFNSATGRIHGSGLTEAQTFADLTIDTNRKAIAAALYADGLTTSASVIKNGAATATSGKAFIAAGEMGAATVAFLGAANVDTALDALSLSRTARRCSWPPQFRSLARAFVGATAANEGWNVQLGYDQQQSTSTASLTSLNGSFDVNARYAVLSHQAGAGSVFSVLLSDNSGQSRASGFASDASGRSYGLGFGTDVEFGRLDFGLVNGELKANGTRSGQSFANQKVGATSLTARLSFTKLGAFTPMSGSAATWPRLTPSSRRARAPTSTSPPPSSRM